MITSYGTQSNVGKGLTQMLEHRVSIQREAEQMPW